MMEEVNLRFPILFNLSHNPIITAAACPVYVSNVFVLGAVHTTRCFCLIGYNIRAHFIISQVLDGISRLPYPIYTSLISLLELARLCFAKCEEIEEQNKPLEGGRFRVM